MRASCWVLADIEQLLLLLYAFFSRSIVRFVLVLEMVIFLELNMYHTNNVFVFISFLSFFVIIVFINK